MITTIQEAVGSWIRDPAPCWFNRACIVKMEDLQDVKVLLGRLQDVDVFKMTVDHELETIVDATVGVLNWNIQITLCAPYSL